MRRRLAVLISIAALSAPVVAGQREVDRARWQLEQLDLAARGTSVATEAARDQLSVAQAAEQNAANALNGPLGGLQDLANRRAVVAACLSRVNIELAKLDADLAARRGQITADRQRADATAKRKAALHKEAVDAFVASPEFAPLDAAARSAVEARDAEVDDCLFAFSMSEDAADFEAAIQRADEDVRADEANGIPADQLDAAHLALANARLDYQTAQRQTWSVDPWVIEATRVADAARDAAQASLKAFDQQFDARDDVRPLSDELAVLTKSIDECERDAAAVEKNRAPVAERADALTHDPIFQAERDAGGNVARLKADFENAARQRAAAEDAVRAAEQQEAYAFGQRDAQSIIVGREIEACGQGVVVVGADDYRWRQATWDRERRDREDADRRHVGDDRDRERNEREKQIADSRRRRGDEESARQFGEKGAYVESRDRTPPTRPDRTTNDRRSQDADARRSAADREASQRRDAEQRQREVAEAKDRAEADQKRNQQTADQKRAVEKDRAADEARRAAANEKDVEDRRAEAARRAAEAKDKDTNRRDPAANAGAVGQRDANLRREREEREAEKRTRDDDAKQQRDRAENDRRANDQRQAEEKQRAADRQAQQQQQQQREQAQRADADRRQAAQDRQEREERHAAADRKAAAEERRAAQERQDADARRAAQDKAQAEEQRAAQERDRQAQDKQRNADQNRDDGGGRRRPR